MIELSRWRWVEWAGIMVPLGVAGRDIHLMSSAPSWLWQSFLNPLERGCWVWWWAAVKENFSPWGQDGLGTSGSVYVWIFLRLEIAQIFSSSVGTLLEHTFPEVLGTKARNQHIYKWRHPHVIHSGRQIPHPLFSLTNLSVQAKSWGAFFLTSPAVRVSSTQDWLYIWKKTKQNTWLFGRKQEVIIL